MKIPKIDKRSSKEIEKNIKELIPGYLPSWKPVSGEPGWAIAKLFSKMIEDILKRLNQVPEKLFLTFLDKLGIKISPPLPAKVPVTFYLAEGVNKNIDIPANVQISTKEQIIFETQKAFTATPAKLETLISVEPKKDKAFDHFKEIQEGSPVILFTGEEENQHILYLGDDYLFNLNRGEGEELGITLTVPFIENCRWEYWGKDEDNKEKWIKFNFSKENNKIKLFKKIKYPTLKKKIKEINTYWIRAVFEGICQKEIKINNLKIKYESKSGVDALFYNDVPIDLSILTDEEKYFYPFGPEPKLQDTFYIASNEAFSKRGFEIGLYFFVQEEHTKGKIEEEPVFSWEYWNGKSWKALSYKVNRWYLDYNSQKKFFPIEITFTCPEDIEETEVNGERNYWIRIRVIGGGYGRYYIDESGNLKKDFNPPKISSIYLIVNGTKEPQYIFTKNNLNWKKPSLPGTIFYPLSENYRTIYLGFDRPFSEGLISIFFSLSKRYWETEKYLEWKYYSKEGWKSLRVKDETNGLTQSGICEFIAPFDQEMYEKFNKKLYWIKIELIEKIPEIFLLPEIPFKIFKSIFFYKLLKNPQYAHHLRKKKLFLFNLYKAEKETIDIKPCPLDFIPFHPALHIPEKEKEHQIELKGIYLNTIWAMQSETIQNEIIGSSDGSPNQKFFLLRTPVIELKLWVKEPSPPEDPFIIYYEDIEEGGFWVLWDEVEDLKYSSPLSRHYSCDYITGEICFGDGKNGLIPPLGKDYIKATYRVGGGQKGNVGISEIDTIITPVPYVDRVENHIEASGGADGEDISNVLVRAPKRFKTRSRAITVEDYEFLAKEASTEVAKVKAIEHLNNFGKYQPNWITIVIVPKSKDIAPLPSKGLIKRVEDYIKARSPLTTHIQVIPPVYAWIDVNATIFIKKWELLSYIKKEIQERITSFLHPLYGKDGEGWDFGVIPCLSDFFAIFGKIDGISYVKEIKLIVRTPEQKLIISSETTPLLDISPYVLVTSGETNFIIEGE